MPNRHQPLITKRTMAIKREKYHKQIADSLKLPLDKLEKLTQFERYPAVQVKVIGFHNDPFPLGKALREIFDDAVQAFEEEPASYWDRDLSRVATFLRVWYTQGESVAEAARQLKLTRGYVSAKIKPLAITLLVNHILKMMERLS